MITGSDDHGGGSTDHFRSLQHFCTTPKETPVSLASWRNPAPITLAEISISLRLTLSRLCTIKNDQRNRPLTTLLASGVGAEEPSLQDGLRLEVLGYCLLDCLGGHQHTVFVIYGANIQLLFHFTKFLGDKIEMHA